MKFTLAWLKDHLDTDASLTEITDKLGNGVPSTYRVSNSRFYDPSGKPKQA